jgi:hypothetical protein
MNTGTTLDQPYQPLVDWLIGQGVEHEIHPHDPTFTARATATALGRSVSLERALWTPPIRPGGPSAAPRRQQAAASARATRSRGMRRRTWRAAG